MADGLRILLFPAIVGVAWDLALRWPETVRRCWRFLAVVAGGLFLTVAVTGSVRLIDWATELHKWTAHGALLFSWLAVPFGIGIVLSGASRRPLRAAASVFALLGLLCILFLAAFTGYLGPSYGPSAPETLQRFRVLHFIVLPGLLVGLAFCWFRFLRP